MHLYLAFFEDKRILSLFFIIQVISVKQISYVFVHVWDGFFHDKCTNT